MSLIFPTLENISRLKVKPTAGELYLLNYLSEHLDDTYEVFFNPFIDGDRPDFIIIKEHTAIFIIEVKDYTPDNYSVDVNNKWSVRSNRGTARISSPQSQAFVYKSNLYNLHLPVLGLSYLTNPKFYGLVHPYVYFHKSYKSDIDNLYLRAENELRNSSALLSEKFKRREVSHENYNQQAERLLATKRKISRDKSMIYGNDRIKNLVDKIISFKSHTLFDDRIYDDLKRRLMPSVHTLKQGKWPTLDDRQAKMIMSKPEKAKIKGVAGCGKTTIIANRAVNAFNRHQDKVLIITFNITLKNLIKDRISDLLGYRDVQHFAVTNYHQFFNSQLNESAQDVNELKDKYGFEALYKRDVFKDIAVSQFQTIFIDEVQDFESEWVKIIRDNFLVPNGEMVLFGDESQNIYEREQKRAAVIAQGFGDWKKLSRSYRTSSNSPLNQLFKDFQLKYLISKYKESELTEVQSRQVGMNFDLLKYHSYEKNWENECFQTIQQYIRNHNFNPNDIVIMSSNISWVRRLAEKFNKFEKIHCMFETYSELEVLLKCHGEFFYNGGLQSLSEEALRAVIKKHTKLELEIAHIRRAKKNHFYANSGLIKLSTVHSFKGLESKTVFYVMDDRDTPEIIYTSITRSVENLIILDKGTARMYAGFFSKYAL